MIAVAWLLISWSRSKLLDYRTWLIEYWYRAWLLISWSRSNAWLSIKIDRTRRDAWVLTRCLSIDAMLEYWNRYRDGSKIDWGSNAVAKEVAWVLISWSRSFDRKLLEYRTRSIVRSKIAWVLKLLSRRAWVSNAIDRSIEYCLSIEIDWTWRLSIDAMLEYWYCSSLNSFEGMGLYGRPTFSFPFYR